MHPLKCGDKRHPVKLPAMQGGQAGAQTDAPTRGERGPVYVGDQQAQVTSLPSLL